MYYDAIELVNFCAKMKITTEQFFFCYVSMTKNYPLLYKYCDQVRSFPKALLIDLETKGYVSNLNKKSEEFPDNYLVLDKFANEMNMFLGIDSDQLWDLFPAEVSNGDRSFNGKTISREELEKIYVRKLQRSKSSHEEVLSALREQIDNGTVGMGLEKWFTTEQWKREDNTIDVTIDI